MLHNEQDISSISSTNTLWQQNGNQWCMNYYSLGQVKDIENHYRKKNICFILKIKQVTLKSCPCLDESQVLDVSFKVILATYIWILRLINNHWFIIVSTYIEYKILYQIYSDVLLGFLLLALLPMKSSYCVDVFFKGCIPFVCFSFEVVIP